MVVERPDGASRPEMSDFADRALHSVQMHDGDDENRSRWFTTIFCRRLPESAIKKEINVNGTLLRRLAGNPQRAAGNSFRILVQYKNRAYPVTCRSRLTGKYKKWVLSKGWMDLIRANNLKAGHQLTLFKPEDEDADGLFLMEDGASAYAAASGSKVHKPPRDTNLTYFDSVSLAAEALLNLKQPLPAPSVHAVNPLSGPPRATAIDLNSAPLSPDQILDLNTVPAIEVDSL